MDINEWGDSLAGVSSSLAFLWIILGYYQQRLEIKQNTVELSNQRKEMEAQVTALNDQANLLRFQSRKEILLIQPKLLIHYNDPQPSQAGKCILVLKNISKNGCYDLSIITDSIANMKKAAQLSAPNEHKMFVIDIPTEESEINIIYSDDMADRISFRLSPSQIQVFNSREKQVIALDMRSLLDLEFVKSIDSQY